MIAEASAAVTGIRAAYELTKGVAALKGEAEINAAIIDIQRALLDAQNAAFEDKQTIAHLADEIAKLRQQASSAERWEMERNRYALTASKLGAFTYDLRAEAANGEVLHRLCVTCFDAGSKSILHTRAKHSGGEIVVCNRCKVELTLSNFEETIRTVRNDSRYDELGYY